jgi:uncharacterized protein
MHDLDQLARLTWSALAELLPYFFLAIMIGAAVDLLCLDIPARRSFRRHGLLGILFTTCLGAFSPFCSFTVIPLIRRLLRAGVPLAAVMSFWIASPAMDPAIFALTAAQIGIPLATARLLGALVLSIGAGLVVLALERRGLLRDVLRRQPEVAGRRPVPVPAASPVMSLAAASPAAAVATGDLAWLSAAAPAAAAPAAAAVSAGGGAAAPACAQPCASEETGLEDDGMPWWPQAKASMSSRRNWRITGRNIIRDSLSLGKWLVFACVFQALIHLYVPTHVVTSLLGNKGLLAIPLAVAISVPLYLNGVGAIPIVGGLLAKGMAAGAAISFLLGGAITTIPAMAAVRSVVNNRVFAIYLGVGVAGSVILGFATQLIMR